MAPSKRELALALAQEGWGVFPVWHVMPDGTCACGDPKRAHIGKHPRCNGGHTAASTEPDDIDVWWSHGEEAPIGFAWECSPDSNIGLAIPADLIMVDIDPRNGGTETFQALDASTEHGFPATYEVASGSGGAHMGYLVPEDLAFPKNLDALGFGKGIDIKQFGGYVLGAGSNHKSGGTYAKANDLPLVPAPA